MPRPAKLKKYTIPVGNYTFVREATVEVYAKSRITSSTDARDVARAYHIKMGETFQEHFTILTLDTKHHPITYHKITTGTLDASLVHPREVFFKAIADRCAAVLLIHNHPSGDPTPSREDRQVTDRLTDAGKIIGIQVLDHIVVGDGGEWLTQSIRDIS